MGQARIRKINGTYPTKEQTAAARTSEPAIRPFILDSNDGYEVMITLADTNGKPSYGYRYSTATGTIKKLDWKFPVGEWVGEIHISRSLPHRMWGTAKNLFTDFGIPVEKESLSKFIDARGEKGPWYRIGKGKAVVGSVYLPHVLNLFGLLEEQKANKEQAIISSAVVAPKHLGKGYGKMLHYLAAAHFKKLGYKTLTSDIIGLNTESELRVWKSLQKEFPVEGYKEPFSIVRALRGMDIIDDEMAAFLNTHQGMVVGGKTMSLGEIGETEFQQYEMDLTDERVPLLMMRVRDAAKTSGTSPTAQAVAA